MKKIYFAVLVLLFAGKISAQAYFPMLDSVNNWHNITNIVPVRMSPPAPSSSNPPCTYPVGYFGEEEIYTGQDSVINTFTYKMVYALCDMNPPACFLGFIREDTAARKVYFIDNLSNPEILLYDFSMIPGNTISISFAQSGTYYTSGTFTLDSIRTIHIRAGYRRIFYLNNHAVPFSPVLPWIESVGAPINAFYPVCMNFYSAEQYLCAEFPHEAGEFMTCFDHTAKVYYDSCAYHQALQNSCFQVTDTCNYHNVCGSVHEISSLLSFDISPNPSPGKCLLSFDVAKKEELSIRVWDISGKKLQKEASLGAVLPGKNEATIDLSALADGIYLVELHAEGNSVYRKIIIRR